MDNKGIDLIIYQLQLVSCTVVGRIEKCGVDVHAKALSLTRKCLIDLLAQIATSLLSCIPFCFIIRAIFSLRTPFKEALVDTRTLNPSW